MPTYSARIAIPHQALLLNEDIWSLDRCRELLNRVDAHNVADDKDEGYKQLRLARAQINTMYRHAWNKMRQEYLAPVRKRIS